MGADVCSSLLGVDEIPDKLSHLCGWCGRDAWFEKRATASHGSRWYSDHDERSLYAVTYQCAGCNRSSLFDFEEVGSGGGYVSYYLREVHPTAKAQEMGDLPTEVENDRVEAWNALHAGLHRAATLVARAALQRAIRILLREEDPDHPKKNLKAELDDLLATRLITPQLRENAEEVRVTGNDVAHPEELGEITPQEAEDSLRFLDDFLETTITIPTRQKKRRAKRGDGPGVSA